ncbi:hypothetical protein SAMN06298216_4121 [Spirosomataceae bacterium TFI 002]|nr:hypothetical protein SAMN06298216_4121 [Spirosomataceae bacterium TFI 002]
MKKKYTNTDIKELIMSLGSELVELNFVWSDELKNKFSKITSYLS